MDFTPSLESKSFFRFTGPPEHWLTAVKYMTWGVERDCTLKYENGREVEFVKGEKLIVDKDGVRLPDGTRFKYKPKGTRPEYTIRRLSDEPLVVKVYYRKTDSEKTVYAVYEALYRHLSRIIGEKIDLILPNEMFAATGKNSIESVQRLLDDCLGKDTAPNLRCGSSHLPKRQKSLST